jgi:hypothetical protein
MAQVKKLTHLEQVQARAIANFKNRLRAAEEEEKLKEQINNGTFFDEQLAPTSNTEDKKGK